MAKSVVETTIELLGKLDPSVQKVMGQAQKAASKTGDAIGKALSSGFKVGVAAAVAFTTALVKIGTEYQAATGQISAATGATGAELESLQGVMENVYGNNYGDSMADVADAVATVSQQMKGLSDGELQSVTEGAFALQDVFQYDVAESVRAANALVNNFGISGDDAMNLIAAGAQNGLDFSGELLDTISEYSVQFAKVGIDADQMFQIMQAGADSGAWNLDKVGDAIKEMSIRVVDGSDTTAAGFQAIGMDADIMAQKFAAGGETAQQAFQETIQALAGMEDPVQQNIAGVNLFGTMWEDLGPEVVSQLASITDEAYAAGDELQKMQEVKYDNLGDALKGLGRQLEVELLPLANELTSFLTDILQEVNFDGLAEGIAEAFSAVQAVAGPLLSPVMDLMSQLFSGDMFFQLGSVVAGLSGPLQSLSQYLQPIIGAFLQMAQNVFPVFVAVGQTVAGAISQIFQALSPLMAPLQQLAMSIFPAISAVLGAVGQAFINLVNVVMPPITGLISFLMPAFQGLLTILQNVINFITNIFTANWSAAWQNVTNIFGTIWGGIVGLVKAPINAVISLINSAIGAINSISVTIPDWVPLVGGQTFGFNIPQIPMLATGGTVEEPMLAVVGDAPETIVPHGNTPRNRALLGEAAAGVGASIGGTVVNFIVTISGGADAASVTQGLLDAEDELERRLDAYFAKKARLSFA